MSIHLLQRYLLILTRDGLAIQAALRGSVPAVFLVALRDTERVIVARAPNVHDHFLWQDTYEDDDLDDEEDDEDPAETRSMDLLRVPGPAPELPPLLPRPWRVVEEIEVPSRPRRREPAQP